MTIDETATVGSLLRARRLEVGASMEEIATRTRIRRAYLLAMEEDRFDLLPGEAYLAGFLRAYAEHLRLPPAPLLARCREQTALGHGQAEPAGPHSSRKPRGARGRRSGWSICLTAAALIAAAVFLAQVSDRTQVGNLAAIPKFIEHPADVLQTVFGARVAPGDASVVPPLAPAQPDSSSPTADGDPLPQEPAVTASEQAKEVTTAASVAAVVVAEDAAAAPRVFTRILDLLLSWNEEVPPQLPAGPVMLAGRTAETGGAAPLSAGTAGESADGH